MALSLNTIGILHCAYIVDLPHYGQDWDTIVASYVHRPLHKEDELPGNPYSDVRPNIPGVVEYLQEREARSSSGRRPFLGHHDVVLVARCFYVHLRTSDLIVLSVPPCIAWEVARD
jgi:hypothetical protein